MNKYLIAILKEMCQIVGANQSQIDFKRPRWFHSFTWTKVEEDNFVKWLTDYIHKNKEARSLLTTIHNNTKKNCNIFAKQFVWNYGWKINEGKEIEC